MKNKILIVGCGGIGSFLISELNRLIMNGQIDLEETDITISDFDKVELKNISYQNFKTEDINRNKAEVLGNRYYFDFLKRKIEKEDFKDYNFIVSCVDNAETRKEIFEHCFNNNIYFIDLRAEGRAIAIFTKNSNKEALINGLDLSRKNSSCQLQYELDNNIIQNGNLIVATIGSQLILNKLRNEDNQPEYRYYF